MSNTASLGEVGTAQPAPAQAAASTADAKNAQAGAEQKAQPSEHQPAADDPDIDLGDGQVFKRSKLAEQIKRQKDLERGAYSKMQEAAQIKKEAAEFAQYLKANPMEALQMFGVDVREMSRGLLQKELERELMKPEERETYELKEQLARERAERERLQKERDKQEEDRNKSAFEQQVQHYEAALVSEFSKAVVNVGLPPEPEYIKWMADIVEAHLIEQKPVNIEEIARGIKQKLISNTKSILGKFQDDELRDFLGDEATNRVRKMFLNQVKQPTINTAPSQRRAAPARKDRIIGIADMQAIRDGWETGRKYQ